MTKLIKLLLWKIMISFHTPKKCTQCAYMTCISNHSPCYSCYKFNNFMQEDFMSLSHEDRIKEIKLRNLDK